MGEVVAEALLSWMGMGQMLGVEGRDDWGRLSIVKNLHNYSVALGRSLHVGLSRSITQMEHNSVRIAQKEIPVNKPHRKTPSRSSGSKQNTPQLGLEPRASR